MRGNHIIWGRVEEPVSNKTDDDQRAAIAECELRDWNGRRYVRELWKNGELLGLVRVTSHSQQYKPVGSEEWIYAGYEWGPNDPKWGLAILGLLGQ